MKTSCCASRNDYMRTYKISDKAHALRSEPIITVEMMQPECLSGTFKSHKMKH